MTALLVLLATGCAAEPDHEVEAHWKRGELPPESLIENSTPTLAEDGIELTSLQCDVGDDRLHYELELTNPYDSTLDAWAFTSLDGANDGHLWGLYQFDLPPGSVRVTFPDVLDDEERGDVVATALGEVGGRIGDCSVVFLGIADRDDVAFVHPVITAALPSGPVE